MDNKNIQVSETEEKARKLRSRKRRNIITNIACIAVVIGAITWLISYFWRYTTHEITNNAIVEQYISPINIRVPGYIKAINFTEHQKVKQGDTLLVLDDAEYRIKVMDAEAALLDAIAQQELLRSTANTSTSNIEVSEAAIEQAKVNLWKTEQDEQRNVVLLQQQAISTQQYQAYKAAYDAAKANCKLLDKQKNSAKLQLLEIDNRVNGAEAIIARRKADLEMCKLNLSYTVVTAPYDGYVGRRTMGVGQFVQAAALLTNIISDNKKWVIANYKETQIAHLFIGQQVNIKVDAFKDRVFSGTITTISEATGSKYSLIPTDNSAGNFVKVQQRVPVRIDFTDLDEQDNQLLRAGMMAETEAQLK